MNFLRKNKKMQREDFLASITYLTEEEVNANVPSVDKLKKMCPQLNEHNPMTYALILDNPNLSQEDREYYNEVMQRLIKREKYLANEYLKIFNTA